MWIGHRLEAEDTRGVVHHLAQRRVIGPEKGEIPRLSPDRRAVHVDVGGRKVSRHHRVAGVILGSAQTALLGGAGDEQDAASGRIRQERVQPGGLQQRGDAGGVVLCAVVDVVAVLGVAASEMIVVRRVDDRLIAQLRVAAGKKTDHVPRHDRADLRDQPRLHAQRQRDRVKVA